MTNPNPASGAADAGSRSTVFEFDEFPHRGDVPSAAPNDDATSVRSTLSGRRYESASHVAICREDELVGLVRIEDLLAAPPDARMGDLMDRGRRARGRRRCARARRRVLPGGGRHDDGVVASSCERDGHERQDGGDDDQGCPDPPCVHRSTVGPFGRSRQGHRSRSVPTNGPARIRLGDAFAAVGDVGRRSRAGMPCGPTRDRPQDVGWWAWRFDERSDPQPRGIVRRLRRRSCRCRPEGPRSQPRTALGPCPRRSGHRMINP
jgi:hypothetical protein